MKWVATLSLEDMIRFHVVTCLVNVGVASSQRERRIYASESSSELFPLLREHLQSAVHHFKGQYVVV